MIDLYVYYKVREADVPALAPRVRALQARVGVQAQLKRRPDASAGLQTWMEVYPRVDDGFPARLDAAALDAGVADLIDGPRRAEIFTDLPPCA
jgi:hypothetical protein